MTAGIDLGAYPAAGFVLVGLGAAVAARSGLTSRKLRAHRVEWAVMCETVVF